jgi:hypothetical protein
VTVGPTNRPLWVCPSCGRSFANPRQSHTCAPLGDLDGHFGRSSPAVRATYDRFRGPTTSEPSAISDKRGPGQGNSVDTRPRAQVASAGSPRNNAR